MIKVLDHGYVKFIPELSAGNDLSPLQAARMSTSNPTGVDEKKDDNLRDYLWRHEHTSPFEFSTLCVEVQCPLFVRSEWHRHRTFAYNEFSQRYSEALDIYYLPDDSRFQSQDGVNKQSSSGQLDNAAALREDMAWEQAIHRLKYTRFLRDGLAREVARNNMPVSNYTKFMAIGNLKNWLHFVNLRMRPNAQYEIRVYAEAVNSIIKEQWPKVHAIWMENTYNAKKFSATEMEVLRDYILHSQKHDILLHDTRLSGSKAREFKEKLGL